MSVYTLGQNVYTVILLGLSIRNPETVALARKLANLKGQGLTETIHNALDLALIEHDKAPRARRMSAFNATDKFHRAVGLKAATEELPKQFFDDL